METNGETTILAFNGLQRWFHKHIIHFMVIFIITGLPIFSSHFSFLAAFFSVSTDFMGSADPALATLGLTSAERLAGGLQVARVLHRFTALLFLLTAIPFVIHMLINIRQWKLWPDESWSPVSLLKGFSELWKTYILFGHGRFGKFNTGQKLFAWSMIICVIAITGSGFMLMFRDTFSTAAQEQARLVHGISFILIGLLLPVHIYLSLIPMNRHGIRAIFRDGNIPLSIVREHHPIWYEQLKQEGELGESIKYNDNMGRKKD